MKNDLRRRPAFFETVWLLLGAARKRSNGRRRRQRQLLNQRSGKNSTDWNWLGIAFGVLFVFILNSVAAAVLWMAVEAGERMEVEARGKIAVSQWFIDKLSGSQADSEQTTPGIVDQTDYSREAKHLSERRGGSLKEIEAKLRAEVENHGTQNLIAEDDAAPGLTAFPKFGALPAMLGSIAIFWWAAMLVCQGEGLELDLQRRRHPMWEWLLSHPAPPGAVFLAEMLTPLAANPIYWGAPLFAAIAYGAVYGVGPGALALVLIGGPLTVAAACLGKALEIGVILRFSPRTRGAIIGIISWFGYASMMMLLLGMVAIPRVIGMLGGVLKFFTAIPWPWLGLFLGLRPDGSFSFLSGMLACWMVSIVGIGGGIGFSLWGAQQGLGGNNTAVKPAKTRAKDARFGRDPLYRKELLWFLRDRSAIVQTILIPLTAAGFQVFNLGRAFRYAEGSWNLLCGAAVVFGTYFLWILGPKSLTSEGSALWIALTWPRGLESLLKAKAWLWSLISTGIVALVLGFACYVYPAETWKIALVGVAWYFFARSMAEKSVTLVTVTSESGEVSKIPSGRRWSTQLGMLTFSIGILSQQWHLAVVGLVFSYMTAAAMWQNFRARLPFLYDPWSERIPPPPTLMHSMVSISIMLEVTSVLTGLFAAFGGKEHLGLAMLFGYGISSVCVSLGTMHFLSNRGVPPGRIWTWPAGAQPTDEYPGEAIEVRSENYGGSILWANYEPKPKFTLKPLIGSLRTLLPWMLVAAVAGLVMGMAAHGYSIMLHHLPWTQELLRKSEEEMANHADVHLMYGIMAVCFAPFAEEYLFRGLLFRTLDREWGGWKAVLGSAAFFTIYHPPLAWIPVFTVGVMNALLFKKSGKLLPAVALHMVYNAVVASM